jgi:hypothetical protein
MTSTDFQFDDLSRGLVTDLPALAKISDTDLRIAPGLALRADIMWKVVRKMRLEAIAGAHCLELPDVTARLKEQVEAMALVTLIALPPADGILHQCIAVTAYKLWARAARQPKHDCIATLLDHMVDAGEWSGLLRLWQDWALCLEGHGLATTNIRPALRLIDFLLRAGVQRQSLVIACAKDAPELPAPLAAAGIDVTDRLPRSGRAGHRLFFSPNGVPAKHAQSATLSVLGLHWWMLLVGAELVSKEHC